MDNNLSNHEQRTPEWKEAKKRKFSSSGVSKLFTEPRSKEAKALGELSETTKDYIMTKVVEDLGAEMPEIDTRATRWGEENEPDAKEWYTRKIGFKVIPCGFVQHTEFFGGSPDGKVMMSDALENDEKVEYGCIEVKCPYNPVNHLWHCTIRSAEQMKKEFPDYYWQCQSNMLVLGVPWCDFVSYDPRFDHDIGHFIFRVYANKQDQEELLARIDKALEYKKYLKEVVLCIA